MIKSFENKRAFDSSQYIHSEVNPDALAHLQSELGAFAESALGIGVLQTRGLRAAGTLSVQEAASVYETSSRLIRDRTIQTLFPVTMAYLHDVNADHSGILKEYREWQHDRGGALETYGEGFPRALQTYNAIAAKIAFYEWERFASHRIAIPRPEGNQALVLPVERFASEGMKLGLDAPNVRVFETQEALAEMMKSSTQAGSPALDESEEICGILMNPSVAGVREHIVSRVLVALVRELQRSRANHDVTPGGLVVKLQRDGFSGVEVASALRDAIHHKLLISEGRTIAFSNSKKTKG